MALKTVQTCQSKLWWEGPKWLKNGKRSWPNNVLLGDSQDATNGRKKVNVMSIVSNEKHSIGEVIDITRFSSIKKTAQSNILCQ